MGLSPIDQLKQWIGPILTVIAFFLENLGKYFFFFWIACKTKSFYWKYLLFQSDQYLWNFKYFFFTNLFSSNTKGFK